LERYHGRDKPSVEHRPELAGIELGLLMLIVGFQGGSGGGGGGTVTGVTGDVVGAGSGVISTILEKIDGATLPSPPTSGGAVVLTDTPAGGSAVLSWSPAGGSSGYMLDPVIIGRSAVVTHVGVANELTRVDTTTAGPLTYEFPNAPPAGTFVYVADIGGDAFTNPIVCAPQGTDEVMDPATLTIGAGSINLATSNVTQGWWYDPASAENSGVGTWRAKG
jgi:hypothetical protein